MNRIQGFQRSYRCFAMSSFPREQPDHVKYGGKIHLPVSALELLARLNIMYPMLFEISSEEGATTNCGVLEFVAEEGRCYLPDWMMSHLNVRNGDFLTVKSTSVPVGRFVKIQPQTESFLEITNPKAVLENGLRNFACLTVGDMISLKYNNKIYQLKVLEAKPQNSICIIEADVEVDFAPPPGYVEPSSKKADTPAEVPQFDQMLEDEPSFVPFSGGGQKLNGKAVSAQSTPNASTTSLNNGHDSRNRSNSSSSLNNYNNSISRSASPPKMGTSPYGSLGKSPSPRQPSPFGNFSPKNAAPINMSAGKLVFGKVTTSPSSPSPNSSSANFSPSKSNLSSSLQQSHSQPNLNNNNNNNSSSSNGNNSNNNKTPPSPFSGQGNQSPPKSGFTAFSGQGNSLK